jgi:hypothetical protein
MSWDMGHQHLAGYEFDSIRPAAAVGIYWHSSGPWLAGSFAAALQGSASGGRGD